MNEQRFILLCQELNQELGRHHWRQAYRRFRGWIDIARERWFLDETQFRRAS